MNPLSWPADRYLTLPLLQLLLYLIHYRLRTYSLRLSCPPLNYLPDLIINCKHIVFLFYLFQLLPRLSLKVFALLNQVLLIYKAFLIHTVITSVFALGNALVGVKTGPKCLNCMNMILICSSHETIIGD